MYLRQTTHIYIIRKEASDFIVLEYRFPSKRNHGFLYIGTSVSTIRNWGVKPPGILNVETIGNITDEAVQKYMKEQAEESRKEDSHSTAF